jgi:glucose 1-dehydrogenase
VWGRNHRTEVTEVTEGGIGVAAHLLAEGVFRCFEASSDEQPWAGHGNYPAAKGGVMLLMKSLAQEVAPFKIQVNSVCPGAIRTPLNLSA